ncbi:MAG: sulfite exporter TauE/SafE family protein [Balneolales bacterium]
MITIQVVTILFFATLVRSAFGFGEALIAVPLLALFMSVEVAAPVAALVSITVAGIIVVQDWHDIHFRSAGWLVFSTLFGIPFGLFLLTQLLEPVVITVLAIVIIAFSVFSLTYKQHHELKVERWTWFFGFSAGVLGGAYGMNGPPLVLYGSLRRWSPKHFRATLQGYFLPASILVMYGYWWAGLWTSEVNHFYLASLPVVILAIALGRMVNRRMNKGRFLVYVHIGLIVIGLTLLVLALYNINSKSEFISHMRIL